jgi:hypothetical protein
VTSSIGTTTARGEFLAPYVPSPEPIVQRMLEIARVGPGDTVYDLGAGDGRIVVAAAQRFGARAVGVELDDRRFVIASARLRDLGLAPRARMVHGDLAAVDLRGATVVTLYQLPNVNEMLRPALEWQLSPGARIVTHDFPISGWTPSMTVTTRLDDGSQHAIFLYTIAERQKEFVTMAIAKDRYSAARASLELGGVTAGWLQSFQGGDASADVVTEKLGADGIVHKHIAGVRYDDVSIDFGVGMSNDLYNWMASSLQRTYLRKDGSVIIADYDYVERSRVDFYHGAISEIGFPACDAASKDPASFTIKISPEYTRTRLSPSGQKIQSAVSGSKQKTMLSRNFQLRIDGLDCSRVSKVDELVVRVDTTEHAVGELRDYEKEPTVLHIPNLAFTIRDDANNGVRDWFDDFVIKGSNDNSRERHGTLEYLSENLKDVLFTLTFYNLGIFKLAAVKIEPGQEQMRQIRVEMYCEQLTFNYGPSVGATKGYDAAQPAAAQTGSGGTTGRASTYSEPVVVRPVYVPSLAVADKEQLASSPQDLATVTAPRLGRPLRFRG